jgi:hypothetical protein
MLRLYGVASIRVDQRLIAYAAVVERIWRTRS